MSSTCIEFEGSFSGRRLYVQLWYWGGGALGGAVGWGTLLGRVFDCVYREWYKVGDGHGVVQLVGGLYWVEGSIVFTGNGIRWEMDTGWCSR